MSLKLNRPAVTHFIVPENGAFPNSPLPLVHYKKALQLSGRDDSAVVEKLIHSNGWGNSWVWGLYTYHHYHSTAHETLCVLSGHCAVQFGGPGGKIVQIQAGDVVMIPAGLTHKNTRSSADFRILGCYPPRQHPDMQTGRPNERPGTDRAIRATALPPADPIYGANGPLATLWK